MCVACLVSGSGLLEGVVLGPLLAYVARGQFSASLPRTHYHGNGRGHAHAVLATLGRFFTFDSLQLPIRGR